MNDRLPFDVLSDIFSYYRQEEDVFHPVETLLLVCKFWAEAALSDRALWGGFKITLGHKPVMELWKKLLPLRLMRSGATVPLDIDIRVESYGANIDKEVLQNSSFYSKRCFDKEGSTMSRCRCNNDHGAMTAWIFDVLVGNNAELCTRWRTLSIQDGTMRYLNLGDVGTSLGAALTSATPSLVSLSLGNMSINGAIDSNCSILPFAPLLREVKLSNIGLPHLPDLASVRRLKIFNLLVTEDNHISFETATKMQELAITQGSQEILLPQVLHELSKLTLTGMALPPIFERIYMPRLNHLSVYLWNWQLCREVAQCSSFPLEQLTKLEIRRPERVYQVPCSADLADSVFGILRRGIHLESIISSPPFFNLMLKWMWGDRRSFELRVMGVEGGLKPWLSQKNVVLISSSGEYLGKLVGDETSACLESLAREWGLASPDMSWDTLFSILFHAPEC